MIVCIAEKPSVAENIAKILGASSRKDGYWEGNGYRVTWTYGHLCTLKEPEDYTPQWKYWSLSALPMIPVRFGIKLIENDGVKRQFNVINKIMNEADTIINCGDAGQEGELIQRWVIQKTGATCPVKRLWISSLTEEAIQEGFKNLRDEKDFRPLYAAGLSRAIGDWLLGMNCTRLYSQKYGTRRQVLSIGRVQTPTLALIVRRQREIDNFTPQQYWTLATNYRETIFNAIICKNEEEQAQAEADAAEKGRPAPPNPGIPAITDQKRGEEIIGKIKDKPFTITKVNKRKGRELPPRLFDLTSLQVECNKKFAYSADMTLKLIQSLYEKKLTTYPRVDTTYLSDDIYPKCGQILNGLRDYFHLMDPIKGKQLRKSKKVFDTSKVTDHHAIIPTGQPAIGMTDMEHNVYDLIARRFIAVFHPDCEFDQTTVMGEVEKIEFKATGKVITSPGWKIVFDKTLLNNKDEDEDEENNEDDKERALPEFKKGESGPHKPELTEKWTRSPSPYTEATLLRAMETAGKFVDDDELRDAMKENGIGRPSTRANIIETLFKRHYIKKKRKNLFPTPIGMELISLIHEDLLKSAELTGIWEKKLREIERREYDPAKFINELKEMLTSLVYAVLSDNSDRRLELYDPKMRLDDSWIGRPCPVCGKGKIVKGKSAYGCSEWKNGCKFRHKI